MGDFETDLPEEGDAIGCYWQACSCTNMHLAHVTVHQNMRITKVTGEGVIESHADKSSGRGSVVDVVVTGECGHSWIHRTSFHKGQTFFDILPVVPKDGLPTGDKDGSKMLPCLWRD